MDSMSWAVQKQRDSIQTALLHVFYLKLLKYFKALECKLQEYLLLICMGIVWIYVVNCVWLAGWLAGWLTSHPSCMAQTFNVRRYMQTLRPNFFLPAMLIRAIDFYHLIPLWLTLTLPGSHKVSAKQKIFIFLHIFVWSVWNLMWWWSNSSWTSCDYFWVRIVETREISAVLQTVIKKQHWHSFGCVLRDLTSTLYNRYCCTLHFDINLIDPDIDSRAQKCKKAKSCSPTHKVFYWFKWNLVYYYWDLNLILILSCLFSIQGRELYLYDFVKNTQPFNVDLNSDIYRLISFKPGVMVIETT